MTFDAFADFRMDGHVAIVTGAAQNIGEAIARTFAGAGASVVIADRNADKAVETVDIGVIKESDVRVVQRRLYSKDGTFEIGVSGGDPAAHQRPDVLRFRDDGRILARQV